MHENPIKCNKAMISVPDKIYWVTSVGEEWVTTVTSIASCRWNKS